MSISRPGAIPDGIPILRISAVRAMRLSLGDLRYTGLGSDEVQKADGLANPGDLLFTRYNGNPNLVAACARVPDDAPKLAYPDKLIRVRLPEGKVDSRFVCYAWAWQGTQDQVRQLVRTTAGQAGISGSSLKSVSLPLPPFPEQQRIVDELEGYLSRLDASETLVEASLKRAAALQKALLQKAADSCSAYPSVTLESLIREPLRNGHSARASDSAEGVRTISLTAVTTGDFSDRNSKLTVADPHRVKDLWLKPGDILIQRSNTPELVGTAALYSGSEGWAIYPDLLIRVRVSDRILPEFAVTMLRSPRMRKYFRSAAKGLAGSMPKIDQATILGALLPVPPIDVQREIVKWTSSISGQVELLSVEVARGARRAQHLRHAVLRRALTGGLVAQDSGDGSAHDLIESIQMGRSGKSRSGAVTRARRSRRPASSSEDSRELSWPDRDSLPLPQSAVQQEFEL
ncbi:hypothetical protein [Streptomyces sp. NPDC002232]|uniref:restriction endonuclease subunit S n=1 Tax=Streptomyces sp. NPDC002232 TaxID=3364640 RepID=UPI003692432B